MENRASSSKVERKTVERKRRINMKNLCLHLASLIPSQNPKEMMPLSDQLHEAANYIKNLEKKIEQMKERKNFLLGIEGSNRKYNLGVGSPVLEVQALGSALEVILISGSFYQMLFYEIISVLEDEGTEIVSVSFYSGEGNKFFHTIHSQMTDPRGWQAARICERLRKLLQ